MPATRKGVYHNLKESEYAISNNEIAIFFSSQVNREKFLNRYFENRIEYKEKESKRKNPQLTTLNYTILADLQLYKDVEKRGFRIWLSGKTLTDKEVDTYSLRKMLTPYDYKWIKLDKELVG